MAVLRIVRDELRRQRATPASSLGLSAPLASNARSRGCEARGPNGGARCCTSEIDHGKAREHDRKSFSRLITV